MNCSWCDKGFDIGDKMYACRRCDDYKDYTGYFYCSSCVWVEPLNADDHDSCPECASDELGIYTYAGNFSGLGKVLAWIDGMSNTQQTALF